MVGVDAARDDEAEARAHAAVLADALMQAGDPRGDLLALELAAANTRDAVRARRLHRAAQLIRDRHPSLAWPEHPELDGFPLQVRAGFVLGARLHADEAEAEPVERIGRLLDENETTHSLARAASVSATTRLLEHPSGAHLRRLQLGGLAPDQLDVVLDHVAERPGRLELLGLRLSGPEQLDAIATKLSTIAARGLRIDYDQVTGLLLGAAQERMRLAALDSSHSLRVLSLAGYVDPSSLAESPIDTLDCWCRSAADLGQIAALPELRRLCLRHDDGLRPLERAQRLVELALQVGRVDPLDQLDVLAELVDLRRLALHEPSGRALGSMAKLATLERLELRATLPARLDDLQALTGLEQLGLRGTMTDPGPLDLGPLAGLPRLRSLTLDLASHTPHGCDRLYSLRSLTVIGRVDLRWFAGTALDELTITGGIPPRMLPRLAELGPLRRLRLPARVLHGIDGLTLARLLPELEELELGRATETLTPDQFAGFPRLRRLVVEGLDRARARFFSEELPEIAIETVAPVPDPLGSSSAFDWRAPSWPRDIH